MRTLTYVLRFEGWTETVDENGPRIRVEATAPAARVVRDGEGPGMRFEPTSGPGARFRAEVRLAGDGTFQESGTIDLGDGAVLRFETQGQGYIAPAGPPGAQRGAVVWRVVGGQGALGEAQGLVTSNFTVGADGALVDVQAGVLELP